jgi:hypothetical protein
MYGPHHNVVVRRILGPGEYADRHRCSVAQIDPLYVEVFACRWLQARSWQAGLVLPEAPIGVTPGQGDRRRPRRRRRERYLRRAPGLLNPQQRDPREPEVPGALLSAAWRRTRAKAAFFPRAVSC